MLNQSEDPEKINEQSIKLKLQLNIHQEIFKCCTAIVKLRSSLSI